MPFILYKVELNGCQGCHMARTKEFDPEQALDRVLQLFWLQGYAATSVASAV